MTIESPDTINTTEIQDGQAAGSIVPLRIRKIVDSLAGIFVSTATASFTFAFTQRGTVVECNHATVAINTTIPPHSSVAYDNGVVLGICRTGVAAVGFVAGAGVTFLPAGVSGTCRLTGSEVFARQTATNDTWIISGDYT